MSSHALSRGLHRVGTEANLLLLAGFLTVGLASHSLWLKGGALALVLGLYALSARGRARGLTSKRAVGFRFVSLFALFLFIAQALSVHSGTVLLDWGLQITSGGLRAGAAMALRFLLILSSSFFFVTVTDPDRLAHAFIRWGVPYRHGYAFILALRFVPFFRDELRTVREAQRMRGIRTSVRSLSGLRQAARFTFVPVLVSGLMRVDTIAMSMKGRAFGLHQVRTRGAGERWSSADTAAVIVFLALVTLVVLSRWGSWT